MLEEIGALRFILVASILNNPLLSVTIAPKNPVPPFSNLKCVGPVAADFILTPVLPPDSTSNAYVGVVVPIPTLPEEEINILVAKVPPLPSALLNAQ
jgi:hypothetical protein